MSVPAHDTRDRSLTALVVIEAIELFFIAPLSATVGAPSLLVASFIAVNVAAVLAIVWRNRSAVVAVVLATLLELCAVALRITHPSGRTEALDFAAAALLLLALTVVLGVAVFGPGRVTVHRILGAVAIYLNIAAAFALAYRVIDSFGPSHFSISLQGMASEHTVAALIYFSFTTLTTTGFGDIVPIDPFARSLANVESLVGQLFPATLLARLITLELQHRRDAE